MWGRALVFPYLWSWWYTSPLLRSSQQTPSKLVQEEVLHLQGLPAFSWTAACHAILVLETLWNDAGVVAVMLEDRISNCSHGKHIPVWFYGMLFSRYACILPTHSSSYVLPNRSKELAEWGWGFWNYLSEMRRSRCLLSLDVPVCLMRLHYSNSSEFTWGKNSSPSSLCHIQVEQINYILSP